jgi:hypothetical protein
VKLTISLSELFLRATGRTRVIRGGSGCLVGSRGQGCTSAICELRSRYRSAQRWAPDYKGGQRSFFPRRTGCSKSNRSNDSNSGGEGGSGRAEKGGGEMHPSSVIHCPGCEPYVRTFPRSRCIARIIQIIASEMIISNEHASTDLAV